jgi:hypothetical protein
MAHFVSNRCHIPFGWRKSRARRHFRGAKVDTQREIVLTLTTEYPVRLTGRATGWRRSSVGATCWDALALLDRRAFH